MILMNLLAGQQRRWRHREHTYGQGRGEEGKGEMNGESSMEACTSPCVKYIANGKVVWLRELTLRLCNNLERWDGVGGGRETQEGGGICIPMANSHSCMAEIKPIL